MSKHPSEASQAISGSIKRYWVVTTSSQRTECRLGVPEPRSYIQNAPRFLRPTLPRRFASLFCLLCILGQGCSSFTPASTIVQCKQWPIESEQRRVGMYGPEDFVIDIDHGAPRLLISSHNRRDSDSLGKIFEMNLETHQIHELPRINEPPALTTEFRPHGIDLKQGGEDAYLYVIVHGKKKWFSQHHWIVRYKVRDHALEYDQDFGQKTHSLLTRPNDLKAEGANGFYVTNLSAHFGDWIPWWHPAPTLHFDGSAWEPVGSFSGNGNGVLLHANDLLIADDMANRIVLLAGPDHTEDRTLVTVSMPDNITKGPVEDILVASHQSAFEFLSHSLLHTSSGGSIVRVNMGASEPVSQELFVTNGTPLSAPSAAVYFNGVLYVAQVFEPFILEVPIDDLSKAYSCSPE